MAPHALSWESDSFTSDTRDLPHARFLTRRLSNLSQASTLVGSESDDIDIPHRRLSTAAQFPATHDVARELDPVEPSTLDQTDINHNLEAQYRDMRSKAKECMKALHAFCDPIIDTVNSVAVKLGEAQHLTAHHIFRNIITDIDLLICNDIDVEKLHG
ncbi:hypothetical protein BDU57DRAFT_532024 [Ampelomyces quisqualis]|uniref:Uncharacterized protein n=1 Tax=Ampelomyces quisqualis TaxID=50730 RepID=A0A6A5QDJ8_AMPQU|nr:hypothetical protein BDU57DRAFT_532024 [Ampelomyces quisqualis]